LNPPVQAENTVSKKFLLFNGIITGSCFCGFYSPAMIRENRIFLPSVRILPALGQGKIKLGAFETRIAERLFQRMNFPFKGPQGFFALNDNMPRYLVFGHFKTYLYISQGFGFEGKLYGSFVAVPEDETGLPDYACRKILLKFAGKEIFECPGAFRPRLAASLCGTRFPVQFHRYFRLTAA
jgi:hypothetical protein